MIHTRTLLCVYKSQLTFLGYSLLVFEQPTYNTKIFTVSPLPSPANSPLEIPQIIKGGSGAEIQ